MADMTLPPTDRRAQIAAAVAAHTERRKNAGWRRIGPMISPEAAQALDNLQSAFPDVTLSEAVSAALILAAKAQQRQQRG